MVKNQFYTGAQALCFAILAAPSFAQTAQETLLSFYAELEKEKPSTTDIAAFFSDQYIDHTRPDGFPDEMSDRDVILTILDNLESGMPDATRRVEFSENLENDRALALFTFRGTHTGDFYGIPATQNDVVFRGYDVYRVIDGQFTEHWHVEEVKALLDAVTAQ